MSGTYISTTVILVVFQYLWIYSLFWNYVFTTYICDIKPLQSSPISMSCLWHPVRPLADCISSHLQSLIPSCWAVNMTTWQYSVYVALPTSDYLSLTFNILFQNRSFAIRQCGPKCMIVFSDICFHGRLWPLFNVMFRGTRCIHCLFSGYELLGCFLFVSWFRYFSGLEPSFPVCVSHLKSRLRTER